MPQRGAGLFAIGSRVSRVSSLRSHYNDVCVTVFEPLVYPVRVVVIVAVELVPGATPVMVAKPVLPEPVTTTEPDAVAVPAHV